MSTKVITPEAILSYPHLLKPQADKDNPAKKAKYSCSLVFLAGTDLTELRKAVIAAATEKFGATYKVGGKSVPIEEALAKGALKSPFRTDGAAKGYPEGSIFLNVRTEQKPGIVFAWAGEDGKPKKMSDEDIAEQMYPGCKVRASLAAFGYDTSGNKGVSFALQNLQKLGEGERLDGRASAEEEFDAQLGQAPADLTGVL